MVDVRDHIRRRLVKPASPAAGAELSITVPGQETWIVESLAFRLVTDATAATRVVTVNVDDGSDNYLFTGANAAHGASSTFDYCAFRGSSSVHNASGVALIPWPESGLVLPPGHRIQTNTGSIQVGDQFSAILVAAIVLPTGPRVNVVPNVSVLIEPMDGLDQGLPSYISP